MKTIILGPPGTGKTTTLLDLVDEFIKSGVDTKRIGYFSFTKKAANEAKQRAVEKFGLDEKDFPYFRTLHSLARQQFAEIPVLDPKADLLMFHTQSFDKLSGPWVSDFLSQHLGPSDLSFLFWKPYFCAI